MTYAYCNIVGKSIIIATKSLQTAYTTGTLVKINKNHREIQRISIARIPLLAPYRACTHIFFRKGSDMKPIQTTPIPC